MKKTFVFMLISIMALAAKSVAAEKVVIVDSRWLPYYGQFLPNYGIVPEIVSAAYKAADYNVEFNFMSWSRALESVKKGKYDAVATASITEERAKHYLYSEPFLASPIVFFKKKNSPINTWNSLDDLKAYKIGVLKGYAYSPEFDNAGFLKKVVARSEVLSFKKLFYEQADLIVMDQFVGNFTIEEKLFGREKIAFETMSPPLYADKLHLMFSKKIPGASGKIAAFNKGIEIIRENGSLQTILARHGMK